MLDVLAGATECRQKTGVVYLGGVAETTAGVLVHWIMCLSGRVTMGICDFVRPSCVVFCLHCQYSGLSGCAPVLQGDDGDRRLWAAVACEFLSTLSVQWTERMCTCVAR